MSNLDFCIDFNIERISNGFIVTGNDSTKTKTFYNSIREFLECHTNEFLNDTERYFKEHDAHGESFNLKLKTNSQLPPESL